MSAADPSNPAIAALVARQSSNDMRIAELQARLDELARDNQRIADALSLLKEVGGLGDTWASSASPEPTTIPEMIFETIRLNGPTMAADIIQFVKLNWKSDVDPNNVRPTLWRLVQEGRLKKKGEHYHLP